MYQQGARLAAFEAVNSSILPELSFFPPDGIDRVIFEDYWFEEDNGLFPGSRKAINKNWWWVKTGDSASDRLSFSIEQVNEELNGEDIKTTINLRYGFDKDNAGSSWSLGPYVSSKRGYIQCLNFARKEIVKCSKKVDYDLKLTIVNKVKEGKLTRTWKVFTKRGAMGPFLLTK
jgi:hypothetical protein